MPPRPLRLFGISFLVLFFAFALVWLLQRTGLGSPYPKEALTLRLWTTGEDTAALQSVIDRYHKHHHNVTIELTSQAPETYQPALAAAQKAAASPDIYLQSQDGLLRDPTAVAPAPRGLLKSERIRRDFIPAVGEVLTKDRSLYGLPLSVDNLALYYHRGALTEVGLKPPATWSDLLTASTKLTERNGLAITRAGISLGTPLTDPSTSLLQILMQQNGAQMAASGSLDFATPDRKSGYYPGPKALDFFTSFANPQKSSYTWSDAAGTPAQAFSAGKAAMYIAPWSARAGLAATGSDVAMAPLPAIRADHPRNQAALSPYVVSKASPNVYAAWDFLKFASSERELGRYLETSGRLSPRIDLARSQSRDEARSPFARELPVSHSWQLASYPETAQALQAAEVSVLTSHATSTQALEQAAAALKPLLK